MKGMVITYEYSRFLKKNTHFFRISSGAGIEHLEEKHEASRIFSRHVSLKTALTEKRESRRVKHLNPLENFKCVAVASPKLPPATHSESWP